jgi:hypothetical protein
MAYIVGDLIFLAIWIVVFLYRKDLRRKILSMSLIAAPLGPLSEILYRRDYWQPVLLFGWHIGIEDLLFAFCIGGISGAIYEEVWGRHYSKRHLPNHHIVMWRLMIFGLCWVIIGNLVLRFNSIYVSVWGFLLIALIILYVRHDLIASAFFSGILTGGVMLFFYLIFFRLFPGVLQEWWILKNISGVLVLGVPIEELMWGFGWGLVAGPAYEFFNGLKFRK